jgi:hypothetical protein
MKSFEPGFLENHPITHNLVQTIRLIAEFKGKQDLYKEQSPQLLETLRQAAIIQSTESSNRISHPPKSWPGRHLGKKSIMTPLMVS